MSARSWISGFAKGLRNVELPAERGEVMPWLAAQPYHLWHEPCCSDGASFVDYLGRAESTVPDLMQRYRGIYLLLAGAIPLVTAALVGRRQDAWTHWRRALRRPDLYVSFPNTSFDEQDVAERRSEIFHAIYNTWDFHRRGSDSYALHDKATFSRRAAAASFPVVRNLTHAEALELDGPVVIKDLMTDHGVGVRITTDRAEIEAADPTATVLQRRLVNHDTVAAWLPPSAPLSTVRVLTLLEPDKGATAHSVLFRMGREGSHVDNYHLGGLYIEVDLATGAMQRGFTKTAQRAASTPRESALTAHPDSGVTFEGEVLPFYDEIVALCERAHAELGPDLVSIGWDVAITPHGPVFVEANVFAGSLEVFTFSDAWQRGLDAMLWHMRAFQPA